RQLISRESNVRAFWPLPSSRCMLNTRRKEVRLMLADRSRYLSFVRYASVSSILARQFPPAVSIAALLLLSSALPSNSLLLFVCSSCSHVCRGTSFAASCTTLSGFARAQTSSTAAESSRFIGVLLNSPLASFVRYVCVKIITSCRVQWLDSFDGTLGDFTTHE